MTAVLPPRGNVPHQTHPPTARVTLRPVRVTALCDQCGNPLRYIGYGEAARLGQPARSYHKCTGCGRDVTLEKPSPWIEYEEVET